MQITARPGEEWSFEMPRWLSALIDGQPVQAGATLTYQGPYKVTFLAAEANPRAEPRDATFSVKVNSENQSVTITQDGSTLEKGADIFLGAAGNVTGSSSFTITKGLAWDAAVSGESWWSLAGDSPWTSVSEATEDTQTLKVQATAANPSAQARSGKITVKAGASVGDAGYAGLKQEINVTQAGSTVSSFTKTVAAEGAENLVSSFTATPGLNWTAGVAVGSWISLATTSGGPTIESAENITYHVLANPSSTLREDDITVRVGDTSSGPEGKIAVTQAGAVLSVSGAQTVEATASATDYISAFSATKGLSWNVSDNMDWLTLTGTTDGTDNTTGENQEIQYSVVVNPNGSDRSGNITVKAGNAVDGSDAGLTKTITVTQVASVFSVTNGAEKIPGEGGSTTGIVTATDGLAWIINPETDNGITVSPTRGTGNATITFTGVASTYAERTGSFTLSATGASPARALVFSATQEVGETGAYVGNLQVCKTGENNSMAWSKANSYCNNLTAEGKNDWYLPSKDQLLTMYNNKSSLQENAGFTPFPVSSYWSSTVSNSNGYYHWGVHFSDGSCTSFYDYDYSFSVRCVRNK